MRKFSKTFSVAAFALALSLAGCSASGSTASSGTAGTSSQTGTSSTSSTQMVTAASISEDTHYDADDLTWDAAKEVAVALKDGASTVAGSAAGVRSTATPSPSRPPEPTVSQVHSLTARWSSPPAKRTWSE